MKGTKRKIGELIAVLVLLVTIVGSIIMLTNKQTTQVAEQNDSEKRRAMTYEQVKPGEEKISNTPYVQFDAFFLRDLDGDGYAERLRGTCKEITGNDILYMDLNVLTNGDLVDGKITINRQNIKLKTALVEDSVIKGNYISENTTGINLKTIHNGTQKLIYATVKASSLGNDTNKYSQINSITLTGTHVADNGTQTPISKTVNFNVDWYTNVRCRIYNYSSTQNIATILNETSKSVDLSFDIETIETNGYAILKSAHLEGTIPELNGYKPTNVKIECTGEYTYNAQTGKFVIHKEAQVNEKGIVTNTISRSNLYEFYVSYPKEAYDQLHNETVSIQVPVEAYYEGFNNKNEEFENPTKSNVEKQIMSFLWRKIEGQIARVDVEIGRYRAYDSSYIISKREPLKLYNKKAEETKDLYEVRWYAHTGNRTEIDSIQLKEQESNYTDKFLNTESRFFNMSEYTKNVGIYFAGLDRVLGAEGYIDVINDETNELVHKFTMADWNQYNSANPYMYDVPVTHIRIETSEVSKNSDFIVYNIKEIDDKEVVKRFTREEFDKLKQIYTYLIGNMKLPEQTEYTTINNDHAVAVYEEPISIATINVQRNTFGTQKEEKDVDITITTTASYYNMEGWKDGSFLVKIPEEILELKINNVKISNSNVKILAYELIEKDGQKYIKIQTENETPTSYQITINCDLTADPRIPTQNKTVQLYANNENSQNYKNSTADIYDVNGNKNIQEKVNYATSTIYFLAPSSLLTNQQGTDYNEKKETVIAPQIAIIDKKEADTANINISIANNYSGTISEVKILGKIPFEGNTFSINGTELGSNYTTQMTNAGIQLPKDLQGIATVYYSEKENPTEDIKDTNNGWTKTPSNFANVKTYLIDLGSYILKVKDQKEFSYQIKVPSTVQYNDVSYSTHAVYFCLDTAEGKFKTQTETSKLGFKIERKYHLSLTKTKEDTNIAVQGAIFTVTEEGKEENKIGTTDEEGKITIENLYVDKTYILKEIRTPGSFERDEKETKFRVTVENDKLVLNIISGNENLKNTSITQATEESRGIINLEIENTPKYKIELTKKDQETNQAIEGVRYRLEGQGLGTGITLTTNKEGKIEITGLSHDIEYTLTEISAKGYYIDETPKIFKMVNNNGTLEFQEISGSFASKTEVQIGTAVTGIEAQDTVKVELNDEKIPTYTITLKKYAKDEEKLLKGAQYKIEGEGIKENGETYITDENGAINITDIYEYVEGKNITGIYTITEITPPEGYALNDTPLQFKAERNASGSLEIQIINAGAIRIVEENQDIKITNAENENANIEIGLEDKPLFVLTKIDKETNELLANAKFKIIEIDENFNEIGFAKDINGNVIGDLVTTNEKGEISYGLKSGLYKAVEIETLPEYQLPEKEEDRTYYFGIGASKLQESAFGVAWANSVAGTKWNKIEAVTKTSEKGIVVGGYFASDLDLDGDGITDIVGEELEFSGYIAKYTESGKVEFAKAIKTQSEAKVKDIVQTQDGGYAVVGHFIGNDLTVGGIATNLNNATENKKGFVIKVGSNGEYQWAQEIVVNNQDVIVEAVEETITGNLVIGANTDANPKVIEYTSTGNVISNQEIGASVDIEDMCNGLTGEVLIVSSKKGVTTEGRVDSYVNSAIIEGATLDFNATSITKLESGRYIIGGNYTGTAQGKATKGTYDGITVEYNTNDYSISNAKFIRGTADDVITSVSATSDGGYLIGAYTYSTAVDINNDNTNDITGVTGNSDAIVIKYNVDGSIAWHKHIKGTEMEEVTDVVERKENEYIVVGYFNSSTISADQEQASAEHVKLSKYTDSFIVNYGEVVTSPGIPETSEITVENELKKYKITTDVEEIDGVKGGSISGEDLIPYEIVEHGKDSTKEIKMVPNAGYKIIKVTVNGEEYPFITDEDGNAIMPQFTEMKSDKHIVVTYTNKASSILVHHYIDGTTTSVAPDETQTGIIGAEYTTAPKVDLERYELKKDESGEYVIPSNASGIYEQEIQVITYYYTLKKVPIIVHHYIEGTEQGVPLANGTQAEDLTGEGEQGNPYITTAITSEELNEKYELVKMPENSEGTLELPGVEVTYYYKIKTYDITTRVEPHIEIDELGNEIEIPGGIITGEDERPYETVEHGEDSTKDIIATPDENYQVSKITVNGEEIEFTPNPDGTVTLNKFINVTEDKEIVVTFEKIPAKVIVHHYIYNKETNEYTTQKLPLADGTEAEDETKTGVVGDNYATKAKENPAQNYEIYEVTSNSSGTMTKEVIEVYYYYAILKKDVTITKTWNHTNNEYEIPSRVIVQLKNGETVVQEAEITVENKVGEDENTWSYTFTNLEKYDEEGNEIQYTAEEKEAEEGELSYYKSEVEGLNITNTYKGPIINANKTATTQNNQVHVVEGEKITYTVTVTNAGEVEKDVLVKDNIPEGTTFVNGSIKVNGQSTYKGEDLRNKTSTDLSNGITVNVPASTTNTETSEKENGQTTLSFEVTVNELPAGTYTKQLKNIATINKNPENPETPDEPTNEVTTVVNKSNVTFNKESVPETGSKVKLGDEITYKINVQNSGTAKAKVKIKDEIPEGTTFVPNSIIINAQAITRQAYTQTDLEQGIEIELSANEKAVVEFKVTVNDIENGAIIRNVAMVNSNPEDPTSPDTPTNETTHTYIEPIISKNKMITTQNGKDYVISGEKITYTIQISNTGELAKDVIVKDVVPEGTTFVAGSIKINGESTYKGEDLSTKTAEDLSNGITINVAEKNGEEAGIGSVSFEVTVNEGIVGDITNTATVDDTPTNTVKTPILTHEKVVKIARKQENSELKENEVTVGDLITYTIKVNNTGTTEIAQVTVEDTIPEGTKLSQISNGGVLEEEKITWTIENIAANSTATVSFTVEVEYARDEYTITNVAHVDGDETNETENPYKKPEPELESNVEKTATNKKITSKDLPVYYDIVFTATVNDFVGKAKVTLVDTLPYAIYPDESDIKGGTYDEETKTITWEEEIQDIDTFMSKAEKEIRITKSISVKYKYENLDNANGKITNIVNTKIELQEPKEEDPTEYETVKEDNKEDPEEITIEIPTKVIVHHYMYDEETDTYTEIKLADDEEIVGIIGKDYTTTPSSEVPAKYTCINNTPEKHEGKMTEKTIEVIYYYKLATPTITSKIEKTATANKVVSETINSRKDEQVKTNNNKQGAVNEGDESQGAEKQYAVLTEEGGVITYKIKYNATIEHYIGKATIEIVDELPAKIDIDKSNLDGGTYNEEENTITWEEEIEGIDTYTNGAYTKQIEKQIQLVYVDQDLVADLTNKVKSTTKVYYPENHPTKPNEEQTVDEKEDDETVKQEYTVDIKVQKQWEDNNNEKQKRPTAINIEIIETRSGDKLTAELNEANKWTYEVQGLPKYDKETGRKIEYEIKEKEIKEGDLEYYENPTITKVEKQTQKTEGTQEGDETEIKIETITQYTYTITNTYKLHETDLNTQISKTGTEQITSSSQPVEYDIKFTAEIADYIGGGHVTVVDTLPYKIDEAKSNLNGGTYNNEAQTITWTETLPHINTDLLGKNYEVNIEKKITVVYKNLDASQEKIINVVKGKVELTETEQKDEKETTHETEIKVEGKVKVKYVDIKTGQEIEQREEISGKVGTPYETEQKEIENYIFVKHTNNTTGTIKEEEQEVIYYYTTTKTTIKVEYVDEEGNKLTEDEIKEGNIGDDYTTEEKEFPGYELTKQPDNKEGKMEKDQITVTYIYKKVPARVIVKYLEKGTEKELLPQDKIEGLVGDDYETQRKVITNYKATDPEPDNSSGKMIKNKETNNTITVIYYYEKIPSGTVTVKYVDIDTNEEITYTEITKDENGETKTEEKTYRYEITGDVGEKYKTEQKEIPYYKLVKVPANSVGELTENGETVIYYYQKKKFNIGVEKELKRITFNGLEKTISNKKAMKIEIVAKEVGQVSLEITYAIRVRNTGELDGTAKVVENIPEGYSITSNTPSYWSQMPDGTLETTVDLKAGEEKVLEITLKWVNAQGKFGSSKNIAKVTDTQNEANFKETTLEDNESTAEIITSVKTGSEEKIILIITTSALIFVAILLAYLYQKYRKNE